MCVSSACHRMLCACGAILYRPTTERIELCLVDVDVDVVPALDPRQDEDAVAVRGGGG